MLFIYLAEVVTELPPNIASVSHPISKNIEMVARKSSQK
jgi:hypothetical protein